MYLSLVNFVFEFSPYSLSRTLALPLRMMLSSDLISMLPLSSSKLDRKWGSRTHLTVLAMTLKQHLEVSWAKNNIVRKMHKRIWRSIDLMLS